MRKAARTFVQDRFAFWVQAEISHQIAVDKDKSIFAAEVLPWRAQKFRLK
jgi:hypothetical protein